MLDHPQTLQKAKTLLEQQHHAQAVQTAASALETLLVELYNELLGQSPPARQKELIEAQEQVGGGQPLHKLTLGRLIGVYRASHARRDLAKTLGLDLTYLDPQALGPLVEIRNRAVHEGHQPDPAEATYLVHQVELILRETNRLPASPPSQTGEIEGALSPWWHTAMPHRDIREGRLDLKVFAIDLAHAIETQQAQGGPAVPASEEQSDASADYRDAETFFRRTFLTRGLRETLKGVLRRLAGRDDGIAITQMATVFGGGKTHTLLALYHLVESGAEMAHAETVGQLLAEAELEQVPGARIAAVDCAHISPSQPRTILRQAQDDTLRQAQDDTLRHGGPKAAHQDDASEGFTLHTLWGEIAYRLGECDGRGAEFYEVVRQSDETRVAPGSEALSRLFALAGPSLILIDETLSYITKASGIRVGQGYLADQAQEFLLELTRAVNATDDVALVLTMTSSEQEQIGEAAIRAAAEIDTAVRILRRTRQVEVSAEREELYEILKRRLFDTDPDVIEAQARDVARAYWDYYRGHPSDFPQSAQSPEYRRLMERAYPFHPALIEVLRDRWGSISGFQRTRGVLRLLALVIGDLYRHRHAAPLIQPAHVNLDDGKIRAELLEYVDNRGGYESALFSDIGGTDESKAPYLDRVTGGEYARHRIATGLATSMFMYSHSGATGRPASAERPQLWLATLQPGIVPALAADALDKLQARLWYLDVREGTYRIDSQPNLNQMLVTRVDAIRQEPELVQARVKQAIEEVVGKRPFPAVKIWPQAPEQVTQSPTLTLVVLDPDHAWGSSEAGRRQARALIEEILNNARGGFRQLKNTLVFALPTADGVRIMADTAVRLLALEAIHRQYKRGGLSETQMVELETQLDRARKGLPGAVWGAYTVTVAPSGTDNGQTTLWIRQEHGFPGYRPGEHSVARRAWDRLMEEERLLERLDPRLVSEGKADQWRLWPADEDRLNVDVLWDYFCRFPYLPLLTGPEALQQTMAWGVQRGLFAYALATHPRKGVGDGETFDTIYFRESLPSSTFAVMEGAWLLRPSLAEAMLRPAEEDVAPPPTPPPPDIEPGEEEQPPPPQPPPAVYQRVTIETPVDWRQWYEFYQAVIKPLVESGAEVHVALRLEASGEIDANLVDLSVKESVVQFNSEGRVRVEG